MVPPHNLAEGMAQAAIILMLRSGCITEADITQLADEHDRRAAWEDDETIKTALQNTASGLRLALMAVAPAPMVDPKVEYRAQFEREQTRRRTEWLSKQS